MRPALLLADLPVRLLVRMCSDRVLCRRAPLERTGSGRPPRHGGEFIFGDPASWGAPDTTTSPISANSSLWQGLHWCWGTPHRQADIVSYWCGR
ncbi:transposase [Micromonospora sp. DT201]|uniref:transposase n=1 Tax=Micromonospora sp. DT201 TaxID=3393442 RepID=UPI003CF31075